LEKIEEFNPINLESEMRLLVQERAIKAGDLIHPLRVAVTGKSVSAGIFEVIALIGKEKTLERLEKVLSWEASKD
jgi:glutamyl-tRNA synthetase